MSYVPLVLRSNFSLLAGTAPVEKLVDRGRQMGLTHLALTDRNNLYGTVPFYTRCRAAGIVPLIGAEIVAPGGRAILIARNLTGYSNLCRVITRNNLEGHARACEAPHPVVASAAKQSGVQDITGTGNPDCFAALAMTEKSGGRSALGQPNSDLLLSATLVEYCDGLYILTEDLRLADRLAGRVDPRYLWLWLAQPGRSDTHLQALCGKAKELKIQLVACPDVFFLEREDYPLHTVLRAIGENTVVSRLAGEELAGESPGLLSGIRHNREDAAQPAGDDWAAERLAHPDGWFMPAAAAEGLFGRYREFLGATRAIAEDCRLELPLGRPIFPTIQLPDGEDSRSFLAKLCHDGLGRRYNPVPDEARRRLEYELGIINELGFTDYFLFVWDIMAYARGHGMRTTGRGSGASSLVSYLLGTTQADPIKYDLPFERFLHRKRADCPDLDIDVCWIQRDRLIESIYAKYGADRVAMVATHGTFGLRSAFREVAKAYGVPNDLVNKASHRLPYDSATTVAETLAQTGADRYLALDSAAINRIAELAERIRGYPRHLGIHCGGIVIGDKPLENYVPLQMAAKGIVITQYEKDAIEAIGLVKMDILGNHGLTIQQESVRLLHERTGQRLDLDSIPDPDPETMRLLREGRTLSCCQLESPAMRNLLQMLRVSSLREVMQALALIRPAPASCGMKEQFIRRARGLDAWAPPHPCLRGVLDDTHGIMLYEDDAIFVAAALAGISREDADLLRRAIAKSGSADRLAELARGFLAKVAANGVPLAVAADLWVQMAKFTSYSFCKAHAASYALMAYQLAYLKAHHPLEFMVAVLNHQWGMYPKRVHLEEAKRLGLRVRGPCVNRSELEFAIDDNAIRVGLTQVKDLSTRALESIVEERAHAPFTSLNDFFYRVRITEPEIENLILAGAFDFTSRVRPELVLELKTLAAQVKTRSARGRSLRSLPRLKDYPPEQKLAYELSTLEMVPGNHPMTLWRPRLRENNVLDSRELARHVGEIVRTAGVVAARRATATRGNQTMEFITLEDECGTFEITFFPDTYRKLARCLEGYGPHVIEGKVEDQYGAVMVNARDIVPLQWGKDPAGGG